MSVATPSARQSAALIRAPVSASHTPDSPGRRGRNHPPPTSGKRPMPVSGMAKTVRSVATRQRQGSDRPTPPPMTIPSMTATTGLG